MENVRDTLRKVLVPLNHFVHRIILIIAQISMLAMVAIVFLTVVLRYCFNTGLSWAEELLVTVFAFIACAIGVRDHMHVAVNAVYNLFPVNGRGRHVMDVLTDVATLLCGLFMLFAGGDRVIKLFSLPGVMPITGISTAWQYLPIPVAGFVMAFDSLLFLLGIVDRDDLLYSEKEIDYTDVAALKEMEKKEATNA